MAALRRGSVSCRSHHASIPSVQWLGRRWQGTHHKPPAPETNTFETLMSRMEKDYPDPDAPRNTASTRTPQASKPPSSSTSKSPSPSSPVVKTSSSPALKKSPSKSPIQSNASAEGPSRPPLRTSRRLRKSPENVEQPKRPMQTSSHVIWDAQAHPYDNVFLRDSCTCPQCVDPSTRQKRFATTDIPGTVRPKSLVNDGKHVIITWYNDIPGFDSKHVTHLPLDFIKRSITQSGAQTYHGGKQHWVADRLRGEQLEHEYEEYMSDSSVLLKVLRQLHRFGLVFIKNVPELESSVATTANRIGPLKNTFYGDTWDVRSIADAKNVAYTADDLGFHMDLLYMQQPPRLQLLHCLRASTYGGMSLFSDSYNAAWKLYSQDTETFDALAHLKVNFHYDNDSHLYHQARKTMQMLDNQYPGNMTADTFFQKLDAVNWSPPFQGPFADSGGLAPLAENVRHWHTAAQKFRDLIETKSAIHERQMAPGECVIFDNHRILHARTAFQGGERWLRGCYLDSDPYLSKLRVLEREHGAERIATEELD